MLGTILNNNQNISLPLACMGGKCIGVTEIAQQFKVTIPIIPIATRGSAGYDDAVSGVGSGLCSVDDEIAGQLIWNGSVEKGQISVWTDEKTKFYEPDWHSG